MSQTKIKNKTTNHVPVLLQEVLETLQPTKGERYLDLTAGYGGHAGEILVRTQSLATLVDRDENAIEVLRTKFAKNADVNIVQDSFEHACEEFVSKGERFDMILADLGVSSPHLNNAERGFSLRLEGPLDMRMNPSQALTAEVIVNTYDEGKLVRILREYGEEPKAVAMAREIIARRPLRTTTELAAVAKKVWPGHSKTHPATRLFQALRIEVNDELGQLERSMPRLIKLLSTKGRVGIITFHSLEDRLVKRFFKQLVGDRYDASLQEVGRHPIVASVDEIVHNPRARSAKLRVYAAKIKTKEG